MATDFYVTIEGRRQGAFISEAEDAPRACTFIGLAVSYQLQSPRDPATGQMTGRRRHGEVIVTKRWGAATPQLLQAIADNEVLRTVVLDFPRNDAGGDNEIFHTIRLNSARLGGIRQFTGQVPGRDDWMHLEEVSFVFLSIEITNHVGNTVFDDDFNPS